MKKNNSFLKLEITTSLLVLIFLISCKTEPTSIPIDLPKYEVYHAKAIKAMETKSKDSINPLTVNTDLDDYGLNGKVKSIKRSPYYASLENGKIIKGDIVRNAYVNGEIRFNELGNKTFYSNAGKSRLAKQFIYEYSRYEKIAYQIPVMKKNRILHYRMIFDDSGKNIIFHDHEMKLTCFRELDDKGNLLEEFCFKKDSTFFPGTSSINEYEYDYNSDGKKTEKRVFYYHHNDFKRKYLSRRSTYEYDENNDLVAAQNLTYNIDSVLTVIRIYNQHGDVTKLSIINDACNMTPKEKYEYKYDKHGNWIQKVIFEEDFITPGSDKLVPTKIMEREISYYDPTS